MDEVDRDGVDLGLELRKAVDAGFLRTLVESVLPVGREFT
jgi:hypothetical protein